MAVTVLVPLVLPAKPKQLAGRPIILLPAARLTMGRGLGSLPVAAIAQVIQTQEGFYPGSLAYRNNNPGNLIYVGQPGAVPGERGLARFSTYQAGLDALYRQIQLYADRGLTIQGMAELYAPRGAANDPTGINNPDLYAQRIASALGVPAETRLDAIATAGGGSPGDGSGTPGVADALSEWVKNADPVVLGVGSALAAWVVYEVIS